MTEDRPESAEGDAADVADASEAANVADAAEAADAAKGADAASSTALQHASADVAPELFGAARLGRNPLVATR